MNRGARPAARAMDQVDILFILGAARSGTTYVVDLLAEVFDFGMGPEGHFVPKLARRLPRYGDLDDDANMRRLLTDVRNASTLAIIRNEWPEDERFDVTVDELFDSLLARSYPAVVYAVFSAISRHLGKRNVGTKNPSYTTCLPLLESLFPGRARYLNVVRDGRDVAQSTLRMPWGQNTAYACAKVWARYIDLAAEFERELGPARFMNLRYEDLVSEPAAVIDDVAEFLEIAPDPEARERFLAAAAGSGFSGNFEKWRAQMPAADIERFERVAGTQLERWGYARASARPRLNPLEQAWFEAEELKRKVWFTATRALRSVRRGY